MMDALTTVLTSAGLGIGAGVNAYATLLVYGLLARFRPETFKGELAEFFASTPVLVILGIMYAVEFVADKVPAVDHVWDVIHSFIRPAAGALVAWSAAVQGVPRGVVILAAVVGGTTALGSHLAKASLRAASTATTAGAANPILSLFEDVFAFIAALVAMFLPWLVLLFAILAVFAVIALRKRFQAQRKTAAI